MMKRWLAAACTGILILGLLGGCGKADTGDTKTEETDSGSEESAADTDESTAEADFAEADADMFTERDYDTDYDEESSISIRLNGSTAEASSDSVQISGGTVTITEEATYIISGTLDDGMIIVDAPDTAKLQLVLDGAEINSLASAPLYILEADKVFVTLAEGSENTLSNGGSFTVIDDNNIASVIFSKQDLTLNGSGSLTVTSPAGHGIVSKDDLVITGGAYAVTSASHALDANDSVRITGETTITADAGKDGIHAENNDDISLGFVYISGGELDIQAEGDGISAGAYMQVENGMFQIIAGGGSENGTKESSDSWGGFMGGPGHGQQAEASDISADTSEDSGTSMKGIKSTGDMWISDGSFTIDSADDSVHSNTSVTVNGGTFEIASGDDAFHADENSIQLKQLVSILLDNAVRHSSSGGEVQILLKKEKNHAVLSVVNSGEEIASEQQKHLFERFYRTDTARTGEDGHYGLGLAIARAIAESNKGSIAVRCHDGKVEFIVKLTIKK